MCPFAFLCMWPIGGVCHNMLLAICNNKIDSEHNIVQIYQEKSNPDLG